VANAPLAPSRPGTTPYLPLAPHLNHSTPPKPLSLKMGRTTRGLLPPDIHSPLNTSRALPSGPWIFVAGKAKLYALFSVFVRLVLFRPRRRLAISTAHPRPGVTPGVRWALFMQRDSSLTSFVSYETLHFFLPHRLAVYPPLELLKFYQAFGPNVFDGPRPCANGF